MAKFDYVAPPTLHDCLLALAERSDAQVYAGGTDLLVKIRDKRVHPGLLVDIKKIDTLKGIRQETDGRIMIAPLTTHIEVAESPIIQEKYPFLAEASRSVGSVQIRNRGTIGGNICNGSPAGDTLAPLFVLGAKLHLKSVEDSRILSIAEVYCGPQKTCLHKDEILTAVEIPPLPGSYEGVYYRIARRNAVDIASVTCAILWHEDKDTPTGKRFRIALGAVAPTVVRARTAEEFLNVAANCDGLTIEKASIEALKDATPITDLRTTCDYRNEMVYVLVKKALTKLICKEEE